MSNRAQRVLDALMDYDNNEAVRYPIKSLHDFVMTIDIHEISEDYEALTVDEEKQVIKAFLEFAY